MARRPLKQKGKEVSPPIPSIYKYSVRIRLFFPSSAPPQKTQGKTAAYPTSTSHGATFLLHSPRPKRAEHDAVQQGGVRWAGDQRSDHSSEPRANRHHLGLLVACHRRARRRRRERRRPSSGHRRSSRHLPRLHVALLPWAGVRPGKQVSTYPRSFGNCRFSTFKI